MDERLGLVLRGAGTTVAVAGGKGASLDRLIAIGVPVPRCGVLTTAAYREFVATTPLAGQLAALTAEPLPQIGADYEASREVDNMFLQAPMPPSVRVAIADLVAAVGGKVGFAVRSSATAEDLGVVSFAGQYRSFLGVDEVDVERAVRLTWASLWHPAPRVYRKFHGVAEDGLAMALIVMRMVQPIAAGVAFTREPSGRSEQIRVELVHGLGEGLVSGALTPEVFVVDRCGDNPDLGAVAPPLAKLPALAAEIETRLGAAQDLEWAVDAEQLWLLQARPITALDPDGTNDGFDVHQRSSDDWTTAGIAEMLPGVLAPRLWELDSWLVEEAFRKLFHGLGGDVESLAQPHALLARYRARAALDLDAMRTVVKTIPGGSTAELEHQYLGDADPASATEHARAGFRQSLRLLRARTAAAQESEIVARAVELILDREPDLSCVGDDELLAYAARLRHFGARAVASEVEVAALAAAAYRGVEALLARHFGPDVAMHVAQRITGRRGLIGNALTAALAPLVEDAQRDPHLGPLLRPGTDIDDPQFSALVRASTSFGEMIRRAGSRSVFGGPTWEEDPSQAWATFRALAARPPIRETDEPSRQAAVAEAAQHLHRDPRWRAARASGGIVVDTRRAFLRREADDAAELLERRERMKGAVLMLGGAARRVDLEISRRLVERGHLHSLDEIDLLTFAESEQELRRGEQPSRVPAASIAARRRRLRSAELAGPLPRQFHGGTPPMARLGGAAIGRGWGASPGRYEGVARIVESPAAAGAFRRGDVLVARTTDAAWVPLFLVAGAIVVEDGGPLSHASIVARELGVPAIVNVPGVVDRLAGLDEPVVTVDGTTGDLVVHGHHAPGPGTSAPVAGVAPTRVPPALHAASGMHVFVTGLIGASAVVALVVSLTERLGSVRARTRLRDRAESVARIVSAGIVDGFDEAAGNPSWVRSRRWYAAVSLALLVAACAFGARSAVGYWQSDPRSWPNVLAWAGASMSWFSFAALGVMMGHSAVRWPHVEPTMRRLMIRRTPSPGSTLLGSLATSIVAASVGVVALLAVLVVARSGPLDALDRRVYDVIGAGISVDRYSPEWMNMLGRPVVMIPLAVALAVVARRCRAIAVSIPVAIVGTGVTVFTLTWLTMRERPALGAHAGEHNSFPGGHAAQLTLLFGLLPFVVGVISDRRSIQTVVAIVSWLVLGVLLIDTVHTGGHWPSDQLAGLLIAVAVLTTIAAWLGSPASHSRCGDRCPVKGATR
jgi:pyruvate,water dikinase